MSIAQLTKAGASSSGSNSNAKVYDPRDTNRDGKVSFMEQVMWDLKHPHKVQEATEKGANTAATYNPSGKASTAGTANIVNALA